MGVAVAEEVEIVILDDLAGQGFKRDVAEGT